MSLTNLNRFLEVYREELVKSVSENPDAYALKDIDFLFARMRLAIEAGTFIKDSTTFKNTCKRLGIKHTYKAIKEFIGGES